MTGLPLARPARVLLLAAFLALPGVAAAQPVPPPTPDAPPTDPVILPVNKTMNTQVKAAHEYIAAKDWDNAIKLLQRVLDEPQDGLLEVETKGPQGKPTVRHTSARAEAERILSTLPKQGLAVYRVKLAGPAMIALGKARANPLLLDDVVRRYFLTDAGAEALAEMGVSDLDRGRADEAADRFRRLLTRPDVDELPPLTLFQAALAFHAAGDGTREGQAVQALAHRIGAAGLPIGGQVLGLEDLRKEIARWPAATAASGDWPLFRGDARRDGRADGDFPLLEPRAVVAIPPNAEAANRLAPVAGQPPAAEPGLPGFAPIAVGGKVIYRGPDGLHALDAETGRDVWGRTSPWSLNSILRDDQKKWHIRNWLERYRGQPGLLDENATLGMLSSDGRRVYCVEDSPVPPHPNDLVALQQPPGTPRPSFSTAEEHLYHNRLRAVDVLTGAVKWEIGAWDKATQHDPGKDFDGFLGAPLAVGRRLFALMERRNEIVLVCLDPETGRQLWSQDLCSCSLSVGMDPARRMQPAHLAYADGVLVCPTNSGAVVAVDPLSHNLLWAHVYRDHNNGAPDNGGAPTYDVGQYEGAWKGCAPIIHGDRVVFTAPDGDAVRCLNLRDGSLLWSIAKAEEYLYVAGVFGDKAAGERVLIVARNACHALTLDKGEEAWPTPPETGAPAGFGAAAGKYYLLPLRDGNIFLLDTANPAASTHIEGKPGEALGNLVFHGGDLWSQSPTAVTAFPQLGKGLERAEARVTKNPRDPLARIDRGRLLFSKGEGSRAVEDWLVALDNNPPADLAAQTQERLFQALTQLLQQDFAANEKYLGQYEKLCRRPAPAGATAEQSQAYRAEQRRRLLNLTAITARGREAQGRPDLALQAYRQMLDQASTDLIIAPDDPSVRVRPDLWVRARVAELARAAAGDQQKALRQQMDQDWQAARTAGDEAALRRFVALYGAVAGPAGGPAREARLALAGRLAESGDAARALEAELLLDTLRAQPDAPDVAARAQLAYARLLTRRGLLADALEAYRALGRDHPDASLPDGKTGAGLFAALAADKRFVALLDEPPAGRPAGRVKVVELQQTNTPNNQRIPVPPVGGGAPPPECRGLRFSLDAQTFALQVAGDGEAPWSAALPVPASYLSQYFVSPGGYTPAYHAHGHFVVLDLGPVIVGVDRLERRARWARSLLPADLPPGAQVNADGGGGGVFVLPQGPMGPNRHLGALDPVGPDGVLIQTMAGVAMLDAVTGDVRWTRADSSAMLDSFGDEEHAYLVQMHASGDVRAVRAVRTLDGVAEPVADCGEIYAHRVGILGRRLLSADGANTNDPLQVRYYDVQAGKDLWQQTFPAHSVILDASASDLIGVISPDGTVTVVDLKAAKELLKLHVAKEDVKDLVRGALLRDRTHYYVALQRPPGAAGVQGDPSANFNVQVQSTEVNGAIYAFDRSTGALAWSSPVEAQQLLLEHFEESPVLLLTAIQQRQAPGAAAGTVMQVSVTRSIDKQTGKVLFRKEVDNANDPYFAVEADPRTGSIDLVSGLTRLHHFIEPAKDAAAKRQ